MARQLKAIGPVIEALGPAGEDYAYNAPSIDPGLLTWCTPEACWGSLPNEIREKGRYGLQGPPTSALMKVRRSVELMDDYLPTYALWTASLPDEDYADLLVSGNWKVFQRELFESVVRLIRGAGVPALAVAVVEIGARRAQRTGRPMPHIHMALAGWGARDATGQWLLRPAVMDELVMRACRKAGLPDRYRTPGSKIEERRETLAGYLSKYMSKGGDIEKVDISGGWDNLLPHQWWNRSKELKELADGHTWRLPRAFAAFVEQQRRRLEALALGMARLVSIGRRITKTSDRSIDVLCFHWAGVDQFREGIRLFSVWRSDPSAFEREADRCTSLRTLACDGADVGQQPAQKSTWGVFSEADWALLESMWAEEAQESPTEAALTPV